MQPPRGMAWVILIAYYKLPPPDTESCLISAENDIQSLKWKTLNIE